MMLKLLSIAAGLGAWIGLHITWWISLLIAVAFYHIFKPEEGSPVLLQTIDLTTGAVKTRPNDAAAQKYLSSLND